MSAEKAIITRILPEFYYGAKKEDGSFYFDRETHYVFADDQQPPQVVEVEFDGDGDLGGNHSIVSQGPVELTVFERETKEYVDLNSPSGIRLPQDPFYKTEFAHDIPTELLTQEERDTIAQQVAEHAFAITGILLQATHRLAPPVKSQ